ncbi:MAG: endonuclease domain-containing protein [Candidatus Kapabacteria bacterium]|nr:endonuclease domain-containing protein [Candidatus Kapabacteria bacterium]
MKIYYNQKLKERARQLRNHSTYAEKCMWVMLKGKQLEGYDFHRQKPIGNFIADFYCHELQLVIEIDGISHNDETIRKKDEFKEMYFESLGLSVIRFTDDEVIGNAGLVEVKLKSFVKSRTTHPLTPS